jgi:hypothetical protein
MSLFLYPVICEFVSLPRNLTVFRPTPADSLSVSVFSTASRLRICTPHAVYDSWGPRAGGGACSLVRRGERNRGKGECRYTASVLRRRMRRLLESEIVTQSVYNTDAEWDGECCWSWSQWTSKTQIQDGERRLAKVAKVSNEGDHIDIWRNPKGSSTKKKDKQKN